MVSIKEVARRCGVSVATVSKALNGKSDIGEETKRRIRKIADEMGYLPNATARALRSKRSHSIGVLIGNEEGTGLTDEFFPKLLNSFKKAVEKRGYEITFINKEIGNHTMTYLEHCRYRGVDGVVLAYVKYWEPEIMELLESDFPVVTVDYVFDKKTSVCYDYAQGIKDLVTHIYAKGHRKIAYIHGENAKYIGTTKERVESFYNTMTELGLKVPEEYVKAGEYLNFRKAGQLTAELMELPDPPTCILYPNDFSAIGGMGEIYKRKLVIPDDISIAGYDGIPVSKALTPELTTLEQDLDKMGDAIAESIVSLIENPTKTEPERILIQGRVLQGESVGNIKK
ncbi:MAG: LacI family transcriptional regulator [Lachnospiraceae bacterium]|nr:LacI family transcriptional regulator [Lachnospiraceae bacterium]